MPKADRPTDARFSLGWGASLVHGLGLAVAAAALGTLLLWGTIVIGSILAGPIPRDPPVDFIGVVAVGSMATFVVFAGLSVVGGTMVTVALGWLARARKVRLVTGALLGSAAAIVVGVVAVVVLNVWPDYVAGRPHPPRVDEVLELSMWSLLVSVPTGVWYGWRMARWLGQFVAHGDAG